MKKNYIFLIFFIIVLGHPGKVFAAGSNAFSFTFEKQKFSLTQDEISSWKNPKTLEKENIFEPAPEPVKNSLTRMAGQTPPAWSSQKTYTYNLGGVYNYILNLSKNINVPSIEPALKIENNRAVEFTEPQTGLE